VVVVVNIRNAVGLDSGASLSKWIECIYLIIEVSCEAPVIKVEVISTIDNIEDNDRKLLPLN